MKKLAIFTEGQTEQLLVEWLIKSVTEERNVSIVKQEAKGGKKSNRCIEIIEAETENKKYNFYILLVNCGTDGKVVSDIIEQYPSLIEKDFQKIIGIRDVYPDFKNSEIQKHRDTVNSTFCKRISSTHEVSFLLAVMEIEAWFLAEYSHFIKINKKITLSRIKIELGIDLENDDLSKREQPSKDLSDIYWLEAIEYDKSKKIILSILNSMSQKMMHDYVRLKFSDLNNLYSELKNFFEV
jgi:hypothetical protein